MDKRNQFNVLMWRELRGIKLPYPVAKDIRSFCSEGGFQKFLEIYYDSQNSILLALETETAAELEVAVCDLIATKSVSPYYSGFILSDEYKEMRRCWKEKMLRETLAFFEHRGAPYLEKFLSCVYHEDQTAAAEAFRILADGLEKEREGELIYLAFELLVLYSSYVPEQELSTALILFGLHHDAIENMADKLDEMNERLSQAAQKEQKKEDIEDDNFFE